LKRLAVLGIAVAAIAGVLTLPALADGTVTATVTPLVVSVTVDTPTFDYGTMPLSAADNTRSKKESSVITATNNGSGPEDFALKGSDATPAVGTEATWTLSCTSGGTVDNNQFVHRYSTGNPPDFVGGSAPLCSGSAQNIATNVAATTGSSSFGLQMNMPTGTTGYSQRSTTVTVVATAH
jgi:hypothetical protein